MSSPVTMPEYIDGNGNYQPATGVVSLNADGTVNAVPEAGPGTDSSGTQPTLLSLLKTMTVTQPGAFYVQNQSAGTLQVAFDVGAVTAGITPTIVLLGPGGANSQGGSIDPMPWFTGQIRIYGAANAQFAARSK